nr:MAG TPA: hypothetical protein [Caudoviricetes sp.]
MPFRIRRSSSPLLAPDGRGELQRPFGHIMKRCVQQQRSILIPLSLSVRMQQDMMIFFIFRQERALRGILLHSVILRYLRGLNMMRTLCGLSLQRRKRMRFPREPLGRGMPRLITAR